MDKILYIVILISRINGVLSMRTTTHLEEDIVQLVDDTLGVDRFQTYLDTEINFSTRPFDGAQALEQVAESMEEYYRNKVRLLVEELAQEMVDSYDNPASDNPYNDCCDPDVVYPSWDEQLGLDVDYDDICVVGRGLRQNPQGFVPASMANFWKQKFEDEHKLGVQWIYYGSEDGVMYNYPAVRQCNPQYDPRYRPFYIETVTPVPKDIVIVIDTSGSMGEMHQGKTLMDIAIDAAITVIDTLNINDRVGIVAFSDEARTPDGRESTSDCYKTQVATATRENKDYLKQYVSHLLHGGDTYYRHALREAFGLLKHVPSIQDDVRERKKVILFLTDGKPSDNESPHNASEPGAQFDEAGYIYQDIREMNAQLNNSVIILTYGLGPSINENVATILTNMASQIIYDTEVREVTFGQFTHIENPSHLRSAMASYYNLFTRTGGSPEVHFTVPYQDAFGSGIIASICVSVNVRSTLKGVICIDQSMEKLLSELLYRQAGESSYFFMVDIYSRVLYHPYMPNPSEITNHPIFTFLRTLEIGDSIDEIIFSIINSVNGNITLNTKKVISRGDANLDGVMAHTKTTRYHWRKVQDTKYVIGVAIVEEDQEVLIEWTGHLPQHFVYHKLSSQLNLNTCSHFTSKSLKDQEAVQFSLRAYQDPYTTIFEDESQETIDTYHDYFTLLESENPRFGFKDQIREYVAATSHFETVMLDSNSVINGITLWRYLATENGIFRIFPATELPKHYDPTQRLWYKQAVANRDVLTFTRPYQIDEYVGPVITVTHVILGGKTEERLDNDLVIGVMGMDLSLAYVYNMITESVPLCKNGSCFLVDRSGFIIVHSDWFCNRVLADNVIDVHINRKEPRIGQILINEYHMKYAACLNVIDTRNQFCWRIIIESDDDYIHGNEFEVHAVEGTNVLLIVKKNDFSAEDCCPYSTYHACQSKVEPGTCFCPCFEPEKENYLFCEDVYNLSSDDYPICLTPLPTVEFTSVTKAPAEMDTCYDTQCSTYETMCECESVIGCQWCIHRDVTNDVCDTSRLATCSQSELCAADQTSYDPLACTTPTTTTTSTTSLPPETSTNENVPDTEKPKPSDDTSGIPGWAIALLVLGILICTAFTIVGIVIIIRCRMLNANPTRHGMRSDNDSYDTLPEIRGPRNAPLPRAHRNINSNYITPNMTGNHPQQSCSCSHRQHASCLTCTPDVARETPHGSGCDTNVSGSSGYLTPDPESRL